jgi:nucleoside-diphosphate-sugar epimerase
VILVTGGAGFVGRHVVSALLAQGDAVRVLSRTANAMLPTRGLEVVAGDLSDSGAVERAMRNVSVVVHLAALMAKPGADGAALVEVNVRGAEAVAIAARRAGVQRFIQVSSGGVYGDGFTSTPHRESDAPHPGNPYERSKLAGEAAVERVLNGSGIECLILRPAGIFGPGRAATRAFFEEIRRRPVWLHASPNVIVHPTHVSDVVQACVKALGLEQWTVRLINVAGDRPMRFQELVGLTARTLNVPMRQFAVPTWAGRPIAVAAARTLRMARARVPVSIEHASHMSVNRSLDIGLAKRVLGYEPMELASAIRQTVDASGG